MTAPDYVSVGCSFCGAEPGQTCVWAKGKGKGKPAHTMHNARLEAWKVESRRLNADAMVQVVIEETVHYTREMRLKDLEEWVDAPLVGLADIEEVQGVIEQAVAFGNSGLSELETDMQESQQVQGTTWRVYDLAKPES